MLQTLLLVLHVGVAIALITLILLQQGRGATTGAAFGGGASSTVFGARGSASFLSRTTSVLAVIFFANCLVLALLGGRQAAPRSVIEQLSDKPAAVTAPVTPAAAQKPTDAAGKAPTSSDLPKIPPEK